MTVSVPHLAEALLSGRALFKRELMRICAAMGAAGLAWAALLYFGRSLIVVRLLGPAFTEAVPVLRVLSGVAFLVFANYVVTHLMVVFNAQRRHAVHELLVFLLSLVLYHYLIPAHGAVGAAMALLGTEIALFALTTLYLLFRRDLVPSPL
jgi:O-antigen/teichoic acid export membrane protein